MKLAPILTTTLFASLCLTAIAQQPAAPPTSPSAPQGPAPRQMNRFQSFRTMGPDDMRPGMRIGPPGMWWKNPDLIQKLSITADQQKRMDDIFQQSRLQLIDLKANVEKQEITLEPMLAANPPDTNKVLAQIDKIAQARAELEKANAKMLLGIRTVLTPDQWTKLQDEERSNRRSMRKGMSGGPGGFSPSGPEGRFHAPPGDIGPNL
jgi:Spy/CpxP family protein refolding chaperone